MRSFIDIGPGQRQDQRGAEEAIVERLRQDHVGHDLEERRREVEELQQREAREALGDREQDEAGHLHQRLAHPQSAAERADAEADERLGERLHAEQAAGGRVLEQARDEAGRAAELRAPPQGQQHDHDERDVRRDVGDAERRAQGGVGDTAAEHGDRDERAHQPPLPSKSAATSWVPSPTTSSTSSMRAKSTAGASCA